MIGATTVTGSVMYKAIGISTILSTSISTIQQEESSNERTFSITTWLMATGDTPLDRYQSGTSQTWLNFMRLLKEG